MANKFQVIVTSMRKKPYNCIDQRKMEFDTDFDEFKRQIVDLHVRKSFNHLSVCRSTTSSAAYLTCI